MKKKKSKDIYPSEVGKLLVCMHFEGKNDTRCKLKCQKDGTASGAGLSLPLSMFVAAL